MGIEYRNPYTPGSRKAGLFELDANRQRKGLPYADLLAVARLIGLKDSTVRVWRHSRTWMDAMARHPTRLPGPRCPNPFCVEILTESHECHPDNQPRPTRRSAERERNGSERSVRYRP
jgi:hypothetical protein